MVPELVPREDLVQAIALNGIGYNLTRAVGPALAGFLILLGGSSLTFSLYAVSILAVISALFPWRPGKPLHRPAARALLLRHARRHALRAEHAGVASGDGAHDGLSIPASAPWALLPLFVRHDLALGAGMYGLILGAMGVGGVTSGMLLPRVRAHLSRGATVIGCTTVSCLGMPRWPLAPLAADLDRHAAVRPWLDVRLRHHPGGGPAGLPVLGAGPRAVDLPAWRRTAR